ncbi:MAG: hypothetical protein QW294_02695 [Candidatus Bathyarchaeia archaeon]
MPRLKKSLTSLVKKMISLLIIFNSIVTLVLLANSVEGFAAYTALEKLLVSHILSSILNAILFSSVALTSILNIVSARIMGKVNVKRFLFHHYIYGFLSIILYLLLSLSSFIIHYFMQPNTLIAEICGKQPLLTLLLYFGITLVVDDISDISPIIARFLKTLKDKIHRANKIIFWIYSASSLISAYAVLLAFIWYAEGNFSSDILLFIVPSRSMLLINLLITALYGIKSMLGRAWLEHL